MFFMLRRRMGEMIRRSSSSESNQDHCCSQGPSFEESPQEDNDDDSDSSSCHLCRRGTIPLVRATMSNTREMPCKLFMRLDTKTKFDTKDCKITGIGFSRGGDLLVSDANNKKAKMFDLEGHLRIEFTILPEYGKLKYPNGVCGLTTGEILVVDRDAGDVKVFASEGRYMTSFAKGLHQPSYITCTSSKHVAVIEEETKKIYMYNLMTEDHSCLHSADKEPKIFQSPSGVAIAQGHIIVSDCNRNELVTFDNHGQLLSTHQGTAKNPKNHTIGTSVDVTMQKPISIAQDRDSNILVLDNDKLLIFDLKKNSFRLLLDLNGTPVKNPLGVATSQNGMVAIYTAEGSTVYIFKYFVKL